MEKLYEILAAVKPEVDFRNETELIGNDLLDSFDLISIVNELNDAYGVTITVGDLQPENFNSASAMYALVQRLQGHKGG